ncbi:MAG: 2-aminoethylphosphonate--pyruvate transaminase [Geminicoccaceae bacterium]
MSDLHDQRIILSPGPVTTSAATKRAMLRDFTPNEPDLLALTAEMRARLVAIVNGGDRYACVPVQGVGNTANEATLGTLVPRDRKLLIVDNGFYGERLEQIAGAIGVPFGALDLPWTEPVTAGQLEGALAADPLISHVVVCHVDTGTGLLNPLEPLAAVAKRRGVALIVDAIASFGGLPIDAPALGLEAIVASPNKWLEGVPGIGIVVAKRAALQAAAGRSHSFCLDLHRQWQGLESDGRWRFTPPAQALAALVAALRQHEEEGQAVRLERVRRNWRCLVDGLRALGFETYLRDEVAAPVIATFFEPADPGYDRQRFFELMWQRGLVPFRGRLTGAPTFRIGCMGAFDEGAMRRVVRAVAESMAAMGVRHGRPAAA